MALSYYLTNRYKEAIPTLKEAIHLNQDHADAHYLLGLIYLKLGRYQEAITPLQNALTINPNLSQSASAKGVGIN